MNLLLAFLPEEAYVLLLVLAGVLMIIGLRQLAIGLILTVLALALFGPIIDAFIGSLPPWAFAILVLLFVVSLFRLVSGRRIADNVISFLLYDLLLAPFRLLGWILRGFAPRRRI